MTKHNPDRDMAIVSFIEEHQIYWGIAPSVREIARGVGLASTSAAWHHLAKLRKSGRVDWIDGTARSFRLIEPTTTASIADALRIVRERSTWEAELPGALIAGICRNPSCRKPLGSESVRGFHSVSCQTIAGHVKRWLRSAAREGLAVA